MGFDSKSAQGIVEVGRSLYERGLVAGSEGNISVRIGDSHVMVTPSGVTKGRLTTDDLVVVDREGRQEHGRGSATSELPMHLHVYDRRPDVLACVHSHAPYTTSFAVAGVELASDVLPELVLFVGRVPLTAYAPPGTAAVGESLDPYLDTCHAFMLRNHGLLTIGSSLEEAFLRHETVEQCARIVHLARQLGNVDSIPEGDFRRLEQLRMRRDGLMSDRSTGAES